MSSKITFTILVVDDDEDDRMIIDGAFKKAGYEAEVKKFINGKELLAYLAQLDAALFPSLIVLDNTLPELEAADLLSLLKNSSKFKNIPVVIYTTSLPATKKEQLLLKGAYACFVKGSTMQEVEDMVKEFIEISKADATEP